MVLPATAWEELRPVTTGVRLTTSKSLAVSAFKPLEATISSFMFQVRLMLLLALTEAEEPVTYIALPISATISPYCCMARAMICDCGGMLLMRLLTAGVLARRRRPPKGRLFAHLRRADHMRGGINVLRVDVAGRESDAERMVDGPLPSLRDGQTFVGAREAGEDRQTGGVGGGVAERAERVGVHVPDSFLCSVPFAVGMIGFDAAVGREITLDRWAE